jgi:hypothetical protein
MLLRSACIGGALALAAGLAFGPAGARAEEKPTGGSADLSGRWRLNKELSDNGQPGYSAPKPAAQGADAGAKEPSGGGGSYRGAGGGGRGSASRASAPGGVDDDPRGVQRGAQPAEDLTITQTQLAIAVQETPGPARTYYPNGRTYKADEGASEINAQWKDGALVVAKKNTRGWKLTETWRLAPDRNRLTVDTHLEGGSRPKLSLHRVYDRVDSSP